MNKILIITKGLVSTEIDTVKQGLEKIKSLIPNTFEFDYQTTNIAFSSLPFKNDVAQGYILDNTQILSLVNGDYSNVFLIYDSKLIFPEPTNPSTTPIKKGNCIPSAMSKQWYNGDIDAFVQFFLHEDSHAEHYRAGVKDLTHDFYSSNFVQVPNGWTPYLIFLLKRLFTAPPAPPTDGILIRVSNGKETPGEITVRNTGATFQCKTLELLKGIPKGTYTVKWTFSPKFMKYTYQIMDVPGFTGIRIHSGNYAWGKQVDTDGCILLGSLFQDINKDGVADIINSKATVEAFNGFMGKKQFTLTIK